MIPKKPKLEPKTLRLDSALLREVEKEAKLQGATLRAFFEYSLKLTLAELKRERERMIRGKN